MIKQALKFFSDNGWMPRVLRLSTLTELEKEIKASQAALHDMESTLQALNEQFTALIETIPDAVFFKDGEGRLIIANGAAKQLFKLHDIAWQGKTNLELAAICPQLCAMHEQCFTNDEAAWNKCDTLVFEGYGIEDETGNYREFSVHKTPLFKENGCQTALKTFH
ncbi:MAG: PAS domain-containing protein [Methylobacter sp.]|nr:PAS domain-containing protein [Methylobacter sp.]